VELGLTAKTSSSGPAQLPPEYDTDREVIATMDVRDHYRRMCHGLIAECVSRPTRRVTTVAKSIETIARKHRISATDLSDVCQEILELSVEPFGADRLTRFTQLTNMLRQRGVL
jgi:hypothetical protein